MRADTGFTWSAAVAVFAVLASIWVMVEGAGKFASGTARHSGWWATAMIMGGTVAIVIGAEIFRWSVQHTLASFGWDDAQFGMVVVAAAVSFGEVPGMLAPARRGHADAARFGNPESVQTTAFRTIQL